MNKLTIDRVKKSLDLAKDAQQLIQDAYDEAVACDGENIAVINNLFDIISCFESAISILEFVLNADKGERDDKD